ncbi:diaminopimelate epimerase [Arenimonas sp. MALMAid1274]|uniref:diaminopimelate epimerase n=1 Tax=Arenimonas sp. MALMAid1274 TaxID=3411630 RepID=UPI003BA33390
MTSVRSLRFDKMHGAGNDFVVLDLRGGQPAPSPERVREMGNRHTGIGFDQLLTIEDSSRHDVVARYRIWNVDGSPAQQCGNGARCVAAWLQRDGAATGRHFLLDSPAGTIEVQRLDDGRYSLAMGRPEFAPARIPLRADAEATHYALSVPGGEVHFGAVSLGNPHAVLEVGSVDDTDVHLLGPMVQAREEFPEGVNVGFAEILAPDHIRLRVYERGVGETLACGSGACAAVAVLVRQGRVGRHVRVDLPGGTLEIQWPDDDAPIVLTGPTAFVFEGDYG